MKLLVDGNILLDVLQNREPHVIASALVWKLCETGQAKGFVSALTFANLVYVLRRELDPDLLKAAGLHWNDYEDALLAVTAERLRADFIITRNVKDFKQSKVLALTPAELLARL